MVTSNSKITQLQLELLKSFKYLSGEEEVKEVKSLLNFYFSKKLDSAIIEEESKRNYTSGIYEEWLKSQK